MPQTINILVIGDILGRAGRRALRDHLPKLIDMHMIDFVVANGENLASGFGTTWKTAEEVFNYGVDVLTNGNHCWDQREFLKIIETDDRFIRPANFTDYAPGNGWVIRETASGHRIGVINLIGQVFMGTWDCPFEAVDRALEAMPNDVKIILVDLHAEATSEKMGMGWFLDGKVSFVYGTHTHIPTCDEIIHSSGTAYQSDIGMTGSYQSIIGMKKEGALKRMIQRLP
ncbi:MAG: metallophosphoesterase, partial [Zetaproteobacteria bacterium CG02_land_8_20_14_3_00_50_9]